MTAQSVDGVLNSLADKDGSTLRSAYGDASVQGFKGTLLPDSLGGEGASAGFNAEELLPINVDPDSPHGYVLMPGQIKSKDRIRPMPAAGFDRPETRRLAADTMRQAANAQAKEEPTMSAQSTGTPNPDAPPIIEPPRRRRKAAQSGPPPVPTPAPAVHVEPVGNLTGTMPTKRVSFDFGPPFGEMETYFHTVIREGNNLVLGWDMACRNAQRYKPSVSQTPVTVRVAGNEYQCLSLGISFADEERVRWLAGKRFQAEENIH